MAQQIACDTHIRVQNQQPLPVGGMPAGVYTGSESSIGGHVKPFDAMELGSIGGRIGGRVVVDHDDFDEAGFERSGGLNRLNLGDHVRPTAVIDDHNAQFRSLDRLHNRLSECQNRQFLRGIGRPNFDRSRIIAKTIESVTSTSSSQLNARFIKSRMFRTTEGRP